MVEIRLHNVTNFALSSINVTFPAGKLSILLGPNGAGKTTMLKVIAGVVDYKGNVFFDNDCVDSLPPYERGISYVPQNNALFPHMTVRENIAFGLKVRGVNSEKSVSEILQTFRIEHLANKYPAMLSGGEARKVALARALIVNPKALLLDEPFTNLDVEMQTVVSQEIMMTTKKLAKTVVMTSHNIKRSIANADNLCILWKGKVTFSDKPTKLDVSALPEDVRFWLGSVIEADIYEVEGAYFAEVGGFKLPVMASGCGRKKLLIPASSVKICRRKNSVVGRVVAVRRHGSYFRICVSVDGCELYATTPIAVSKGESVNLRLNEAIILGEENA